MDEFAENDRQWQHKIKGREADGICPVCRKEPVSHAHHLITRARKYLKRHLMNGLGVGIKCHENPAMILRWLEENRPRQYQWYLENRRKCFNKTEILLGRV
jgi:hypothetical protein